MFNKKKILILGGGFEQLPGIKISKSLGIYTIVIDINKYCPGKKYSNKFYNVSTDNFKKVFKISKKENIDGICTFASEKPLRIISKVSKSIKTFSQDLNVINNILNKHNSKKIFKKNKISHIKGSIFNLSKKKKINKFLDFSNGKKYVIKPSDSFGQNGVNLIQNKKNLAYKINNAYKFSTEKKIVIENFEEGTEINLVGIVEDRKIKIISTSQRYTNHDLSFGIAFKHIYPIKLDQKKSIKIKNLCKKIIKAFRINNTVIYFQFLMKENNFKVIEIATRTPGGFMYELSKLVSGYDIIKFTILKSLGVKNSLNKCNIKKKKYKNLIIKFLTEYDFLYKKNLYLRKKSFYNLKGFVDLIIYTNKKKKLRNSGGRIGGLFITGKTIKKCKKNLKNMIDKFNLYEDKKFT